MDGLAARKRRTRMKRRLLSILTCLALCLGLLPATVLAADEESGAEIEEWIDATLSNPKVGWGKDGSYDITWYVTAPAEQTVFTLYDAADLAGLAVIVNGTYNITGDEIWNNAQAELSLDRSTPSTLQDSFKGKTIILAPGVTFDLSGKLWIPIGYRESFQGTFEGNSQYGTTITNMIVQTSSGSAGLFGTAVCASIQNVAVENASITANLARHNAAGGIVGWLSGSSTGSGAGQIGNCSFAGTIHIPSSDIDTYAGGIVGVSGRDSVNQIYTGFTVEDCVSYAAITGGAAYNGGIVGWNDGNKAEDNKAEDKDNTVQNCRNYGEITLSKGTYMGGIVGSTLGTVTDCQNYGELSSTGLTTIGGVAGWMGDCTISNCINEGTITQDHVDTSTGTGSGSSGGGDGGIDVDVDGGSGDFIRIVIAGGIVGIAEVYGKAEQLVIENCHNRGNITSNCTSTSGSGDTNAYVGGVLCQVRGWGDGNYSISITQCSNTGNLSASGNRWSSAGGLAEDASAKCTFSQCYNAGTVTASTQAGSSLEHVYSYAGGLVSKSGGNFENCYNVGKVTSNATSGTNRTAYAGGLVGNIDEASSFTNCYNAGTVTCGAGTGGTCSFGGIVGKATSVSPTINTTTYWEGCVEDANIDYGESRTANQMTEDHLWSEIGYTGLGTDVWTKQYNDLTGSTLTGYLPVLIGNRQSPDPRLTRTAKTPAAGSLTVTPSKQTISVNEQAALTASGTSVDINKVVWFSRDESVATVSGSGANATVTGRAPGQVQIIAAIPGGDNQNDIIGTATITVTETISAVSIGGLTAPVQGETPVDKDHVTAGTQCAVDSVSWTVDDSSVSGSFTANKIYTAAITLKANDHRAFASGVAVTLTGTADGTYNQPTATKNADDTLTVTVTFNPVAHRHNWDTGNWINTDPIYHWLGCTNEGCPLSEEEFKKAEYGYDRHMDNGKGVCLVCGATIGYTVTLNYNYGEGVTSPADETLRTNVRCKLTEALPVPTREGWSFEGWYTAADGGNKVTGSESFKENTTLHAHWSNTTISYVTINGLKAPVQGENPVKTIMPPENSSYSFTNPYGSAGNVNYVVWFNQTSPTSPVTSAFQCNETYQAITYVAAEGFSFANNIQVTLEGVDPDCVKEIKKEVMKDPYDPYDENNTYLKITVTFVPVAHKHSNFTYWNSNATQHWHTCIASGCDAQKDTNGYGMVGLENHVDVDDNGVCDICNKTIGYRITFSAGEGRFPDGNFSQDIYTKMDGTLRSLPETPTRSGWFFDGWYTEANGGTKVTLSTETVFTEGTAYYAHWRQDSITEVTVIGLEAPSVGARPKTTFSVPDGDDVHYDWRSATQASWTDPDNNKVSGSFQSDTAYTVTLYLNSDEGYYFGDTATTNTSDYEQVSNLTVTLSGVPSDSYSQVSVAQKKSYSNYILRVTVSFDETQHEHQFADGKPWSHDENCHWNTCTADTCTAEGGKVNLAKHSYDNSGKCKTCGYSYVGYEVTFDANGGSVTPTSAYTDSEGKLTIDLPTPTRPDYEFLGWFTERNGGTQVDKNRVYSQDTTLYAHWQEITKSSITVYCEIDRGSATADPSTSVEEGKLVTLYVTPNPGYYLGDLTVTGPNQTNIPYQQSQTNPTQYTFTMPAGDVTVNVSFALEGDFTITGLPENIDTSTQPFTLTAEGGSGTGEVTWASSNTAAATVAPTGDSTTATVTIVGPGQTLISAQRGNEFASVIVQVNGTSISAVTLNGLTKLEAGGTPATHVTAPDNAGYSVIGVNWKDSEGNPVSGSFENGKAYTAVITLTADGSHVFPSEGSIPVVLNGLDESSYTSATAQRTDDTTLSVTVVFPAVGHTHSWTHGYDALTHWQTCTVDGCGETTAPEKHTDLGNGTCSVCKQIIGYAITLDYNDGTTTPVTFRTNTDGKLTNLPTPTRDDYHFVGWYTAEADGDLVTDNTTFSKDVTIYARWTKDQLYRVTVAPSANGSVIAAPTEAAEGTLVTLTVTPDTGYELQNLTVSKAAGGPVSVTGNKFIMPDEDVTVQAVFAPVSAQLTINGLPGGTIYQGTAFQLTVSGGSGTVSWRSADSSVATVDQSGYVSIVGIGSVTIYAQRGDQTADISFTAYGADISAVTILNLIAPVQGEAPGQTILVPPDAPYGPLSQMGVGSSSVDVQWTDSQGQLMTGPFAAEEVYTVKILLSAKGDYFFADQVAVTLESLKPGAYSDVQAKKDAEGNLEVTVVFNALTHQHDWAAEWSSDPLHHWHECLAAESCPVEISGMKDYGYHRDLNGDGICDDCHAAIGYTITFHPNGGTVTPTSIKTNAYGQLTVSLPIPVNGTSTFTGWFLADGTRVTESTMFSQDTIVYARWYVPSTVGSDDSEPSYSVDVSKNIIHGTVHTSHRTAEAGTSVTLTVTPDEGYALVSLTVTNRNGIEMELTDKGGGKFTFRMPSGKVTVEAVFGPIKLDYSTCTGGADCPLWNFSDLDVNAWYHDGVHFCLDEGLMNGTSATTFNPNGTITRQQVWMILARISGADPADMAAARTWAMANGISDGTNPGNPVTRQQFAAMLYRYAVQNGMAAVTTQELLSGFPDAASVSSYAVQALNWAVAQGIIGGMTDGTLNPAGPSTRAQTAVMLYRWLA